jgi:putative FmdB family regulatory protein
MPIYEYECMKCGQKFELRRSMADSDKDTQCPWCGAENSKRVFSVFATTASSVGACAPGSST